MAKTKSHSARGRKATKTGKWARSRPRTRAKPMKRTGKKGAYKKGKVMAMAIRRNPMVENKTRELADIAFGDTNTQINQPMNFNELTPQQAGQAGAIQTTGIFNLLTLANFYTQFQVGYRVAVNNEDRIIGSNIFAKYLNVKGTIRWPVNENIQKTPQELEMIWGTCPAFNRTTNTAPAVTAVSPADIEQHIIQQVSEYMNAASDKLRFHPKRDRNCKIYGRRMIRPKQGRQYTLPAGPIYQVNAPPISAGVIPDTDFNVSFKFFKKLHYDQGGVISYIDGNGTTIDEQCHNLNDHPLPFVVFYQPNHGVINGGAPTNDTVPSVAYNSMFYFTDS